MACGLWLVACGLWLVLMDGSRVPAFSGMTSCVSLGQSGDWRSPTPLTWILDCPDEQDGAALVVADGKDERTVDLHM